MPPGQPPKIQRYSLVPLTAQRAFLRIYMLAAAGIQQYGLEYMVVRLACEEKNRGHPGVIEFCSASHEQSCVSTSRT